MLPARSGVGARGGEPHAPAARGRRGDMKTVLGILGALLGVALAGSAETLFGLLIGALVGLGVAEGLAVRDRVRELEREVEALRRRIERWVAGSAERSEVRQAPGAPPPAAAPPAGSASAAPARPPAPPVTPPAPATSAAAERPQPPRAAAGPAAATAAEWPLVLAVREYFTGGNTLVRIGIVILFFGVAFLLRYVAERTQLSIELRLAAVAAGALALLALGWRLRRRRAGYALALQGGAVGILYLTVFVALRLYGVLPPAAAFALMVLLVAFSAALAVLQSSMALAALGSVGGFLAPVLASTGAGSHVVLFGYYALLNAGILAIAWFRAWRPLNLLGFAFTFVIGAAWGVLRYRPELFASTEPFLVLFFYFYVAIAVLYALREAPDLRGYLDGTLVFGTPLVAFGMQSALLRERPLALALSALVVSASYLLLARALHVRRGRSQRLLVEAFLALGVAFLTLAIPLALDGRWSAATWALEGAALVWIGCRQHRRLPRIAGVLLQLGAGVLFWRDVGAPIGPVPVLNSACLGGLMLSAAAVFAAHVLLRAGGRLEPYERPLPAALFFWGLLWWSIAGLAEIDRALPARYELAAGTGFAALTAIVASELVRRLALGVARVPALALLPALALCAVIAAFDVRHPLGGGGWLAWPFAFAVWYVVLRRHEAAAGRLAGALHAGSLWLVVALASWEIAWWVERTVAGARTWPAVVWGLLPALALGSLPRLVRQVAWPFGAHRRAYLALAGGGLALYLAGWVLLTSIVLRGEMAPLPYVPLVNPLDLTSALGLLGMLRQVGLARREGLLSEGLAAPPVLAGLLAALGFVWLNAALLRTLHHWAGIPFDVPAMLGSTLVQTALSIFWTVLALGTMLFATRRAERLAWLTGAVLLAVVIGKLFLVDLARVGTVERIVSFLGVGLLMLVIGWFSPLPPALREAPPRQAA